MSSNDEKLFDEFPPHSYEDWRKAAEALLKGAPFEKKLITKLHEGITLQPIYRKEDVEGLEHLNHFPGTTNYVRGAAASGFCKKGWEISNEYRVPTPEELAPVMKDAILRGQTELNIQLDHMGCLGLDPDQVTSGEVGVGGLSLSTIQDMEKIFAETDLTKTSLFFKAGSSNISLVAMIAAIAKKKNVSLESIRGCVDCDPVSQLMESGKLPFSFKEAFNNMFQATKYAAENIPNLQTITVNGTAYHNGGGSAVEELGYVLATGVEYIREMTNAGLDIDTVASKMRFVFSIGGNFFMEIAKFRAARILWAKVIESFGGKPESGKMYIHAKTGSWNKTIFDPYVNMLRVTTEGFSAIVGGCEGIEISPFDETVRLSDEFSRRVARNTQLVLGEECDLKNIIDPAGGSWYVEWLTDQVASKSWKIFQGIEEEGGQVVALKSGIPQKQIAETAEAKINNLGKRKELLVGTNIYPNFTEKLLEKRETDYDKISAERSKVVKAFRKQVDQKAKDHALQEFKDKYSKGDAGGIEAATEAILNGATIGELAEVFIGKGDNSMEITPISQKRWASNIEALKFASLNFEKETGRKPEIFQANLGPSRFYRARADWVSAFYQVAGFNVVNDKDFDLAAEAAEEAIKLKSKIVVITSTDDKYEQEVPTIAKMLKDADPNVYIIVATAPGELEKTYREAGVDDFVNVRVNNYEMLKKLLSNLGAL